MLERVVGVSLQMEVCMYCFPALEVVAPVEAGGCDLVTPWRAQSHCSNPVAEALGAVMAPEAAPHSRSANVGLSIRLKYNVT